MSVSNIRAHVPAMRRSGPTMHERENLVERASRSLAGEFLRAAAGKERAVVLMAMGMFLGQVERVTGGSDRSEAVRLIEAAMDHHVKT